MFHAIPNEATEGIICQTFISRPQPDLTLLSALLETTEQDRKYYSIAVYAFSAGSTTESAMAWDISCSEAAARQIFRRICDGCVTPCTLTDVLSDWICESNE